MVLPERGKGVFRTGNAARQAGWIMRDGGAFAGLVCDTRMAGDTVGFRGAPYIDLSLPANKRGVLYRTFASSTRANAPLWSPLRIKGTGSAFLYSPLPGRRGICAIERGSVPDDLAGKQARTITDPLGIEGRRDGLASMGILCTKDGKLFAWAGLMDKCHTNV